MEANGKELIMFYYESHDYMDLHPEQHFRTIESKELMDEFIKHMREHWCSGTTSDAHEVTPLEFFKARQSRYWYGCEEMLDEAALDCKQPWVDEYYFYVNNKNRNLDELIKEWNDHMEDIITDYCDREF